MYFLIGLNGYFHILNIIGEVSYSYNILINMFYFLDIIGEVFELGRVQTVQVHDGEKKRLQFRMRDTT